MHHAEMAGWGRGNRKKKRGRKNFQGWCGYGLSAVSEPGNHDYQLAAEGLSSTTNWQPLSSAR